MGKAMFRSHLRGMVTDFTFFWKLRRNVMWPQGPPLWHNASNKNGCILSLGQSTIISYTILPGENATQLTLGSPDYCNLAAAVTWRNSFLLWWVKGLITRQRIIEQWILVRNFYFSEVEVTPTLRAASETKMCKRKWEVFNTGEQCIILWH